MRTLHQLSTSDEKMLLLAGKIEKPYLVYLNDEIPAIFFQTGRAGAQPKLAHAYYVLLPWRTGQV